MLKRDRMYQMENATNVKKGRPNVPNGQYATSFTFAKKK